MTTAGTLRERWICDYCNVATFDSFVEAERHEATCYARPSCTSSSDVTDAVIQETNEVINVDTDVNVTVNNNNNKEEDVCIVPNPKLNSNEISSNPRKSKRKPVNKPSSSTNRKSKQSTLSNHLAGKSKRELRSSVKSKGVVSKKEVHSFFKMHANPKEKERIKENKEFDRGELASLSAKELKAAKFAAELTERRNMERKRNSEKRKHFSNGDHVFGLFHSKKVHDNNNDSGKQQRKDKENNDCSGKDDSNNKKSKAKAKESFSFIKPQTQNSKTMKATNEVKEEKRIFFPVPSYIQISDDDEPMNIHIPVESRFNSSLDESLSSPSSSLEPMKLLCSNEGITNNVSHTDLLHTPDDDVYSLIYNYLEQMNEHGWEEDIKLMRSAWSNSCGGDVTCPRRVLEFGSFNID